LQITKIHVNVIKEAIRPLFPDIVTYYAGFVSMKYVYSTDTIFRYRLRPRMLRDVSNVNMKTTIMGNEIDFPIGIAPTAMQKMAHPEGEVATAKG